MHLLSCSALALFLVAFVDASVDNNATSAGDSSQLVSNECARCLCESRTGCKNEDKCVLVETYSACGLMAITKPYWIDACKPTVEGDKPDDKHAFVNCARDYKCSKTALERYMKRYKKDCNGDGVIDCKDFAAIHLRGAGICGDSEGTEFGKTVGKCERERIEEKEAYEYGW